MADLDSIERQIDKIIGLMQNGGGTTSGNGGDSSSSGNSQKGKNFFSERNINRFEHFASQLADTVSTIIIGQLQKQQNTWMAQQNIYLKTLDTGKAVFQRHMNTFGKGMNSAISSTFTSILQGVNEGAYKAASASVDYATEEMKNTLKDFSDRASLGFYKTITLQETALKNLQETYKQLGAGTNLATGLVSTIGGAVGGLVGAWSSLVGGIVQSVISNYTKIDTAKEQIQVEQAKKNIEVEQKKIDILRDIQSDALDIAKNSYDLVLNFANSIEKVIYTQDENAKAIINTLGISGRNTEIYEKFFYGALKNLRIVDSNGKTTYLNEDSKSLLEAQRLYNEASTRNQVMSAEDFIKNSMLGTVLGDKNLASTLLGDMDYFNKSVATGTDMIFEMFKEANKAGVSNKKFAKELQQNLKLAQKYTFKGGVKSMMEMSIWAQKVRFNMQNLEGLVDKIQDGGLEGIITEGAKLQVLGGQMAMGADPLAMMYEAWADPEALAKRFVDMTKGIGTFNKKTGEVDIVGADAMRLKQYAETIGMNYTDARAQVTQRLKGEQIDRQLTANYNDAQKALLYNKAKLNANGQWEVTLDDGTVKNINNLRDTDWNSLMPTEESIENYVSKIYSILNQEEAAKKKQQADLADATRGTIFEEFTKRLNITLESTKGKLGDELVDLVSKGAKEATNALKQQYDRFGDISNRFDEILTVIQKSIEETNKIYNDNNSPLFKVLAYLANPTEEGKKALLSMVGESANNNSNNRRRNYVTYNNATKQTIHNLKPDELKYLEEQGWPKWTVGEFNREGKWQWREGVREALVKYRKNKALSTYNKQNINDGIISSGEPKVTRINDGLVKSDPKDVAIFAKEGGVIGGFLDNLYQDTRAAMSGGLGNGQPLKIEISGKLDLESDGQTINIINEIKNNPVLIRTISQMLAQHMSSAINGGRGRGSLTYGSV